jgi:hypothetical protein
MKLKILLVLIILFAIVYWRGTKQILAARNTNCNWHTVYAICVTDSKKVYSVQPPSLMDTLKAGASIQNFKF